MTSNDPLIGKQIGNYRILAEINSGSFGSVYQGRHVIFDDEPVVAIKLLHTTLRSPQEHTEFIKEAQVLKKLNHPHILRILDAGFQDGTPYLVTDYAAGGSLRDRLKRSNSQLLPLNQALNILTQIAQALQYAHEQHIIHRDLKPENILFNQEGDALLADFGIAILLASTGTGLVGISGTPPYMAPEQFEGLVSTKSDQYSLGCIAYELVTGHRLYSIPSPTLETYWFHHAKVDPIPPTRHQPQLPVHIEQAILIALAKNRAHRYRDIAAFSNALLKSNNQWIDEGNMHFEAGRYEEALDAFEQAIHYTPNLAGAYIGRDKVLQQLGFSRKAQEDLAAQLQQTLQQLTDEQKRNKRLTGQLQQTLQQLTNEQKRTEQLESQLKQTNQNFINQQYSHAKSMWLRGAAKTDVGRQCVQNEDSPYIYISGELERGLFIVADGMSGLPGGEIASRLAVQKISEALKSFVMPISSLPQLRLTPLSDQDIVALSQSDREKQQKTRRFSEQSYIKNIEDSLKAAVRQANRAILSYGEEQSGARGLGCTVTSALVQDDQAFIVNVGDSRIYLLRNGELTVLTKDHSLVQRLVDEKQITPDEVYTHPQRNLIYRSLGAGHKHVDPDVFHQPLQDGDTLLLCSDGLWKMVRKEALLRVLKQEHDPLTICDALIDLANANGGEENITVVVVQIKS